MRIKLYLVAVAVCVLAVYCFIPGHTATVAKAATLAKAAKAQAVHAPKAPVELDKDATFIGYGKEVVLTYALNKGLPFSEMFSNNELASAVFTSWEANCTKDNPYIIADLAYLPKADFDDFVNNTVKKVCIELDKLNLAWQNDSDLKNLKYIDLFTSGRKLPANGKVKNLLKDIASDVNIPFFWLLNHPSNCMVANVITGLLHDAKLADKELYFLYHTKADAQSYTDDEIYDVVAPLFDGEPGFRILRHDPVDAAFSSKGKMVIKAVNNQCCNRTTRQCGPYTGGTCTTCSGGICCLACTWCPN